MIWSNKTPICFPNQCNVVNLLGKGTCKWNGTWWKTHTCRFLNYKKAPHPYTRNIHGKTNIVSTITTLVFSKIIFSMLPYENVHLWIWKLHLNGDCRSKGLFKIKMYFVMVLSRAAPSVIIPTCYEAPSWAQAVCIIDMCTFWPHWQQPKPMFPNIQSIKCYL